MQTKKTVLKKTIVEKSLAVTREDFCSIFHIPETAEDVRVYVATPGGGDYSNTILDIDDKNGDFHVFVEWTEVEIDEKEE